MNTSINPLINESNIIDNVNSSSVIKYLKILKDKKNKYFNIIQEIFKKKIRLINNDIKKDNFVEDNIITNTFYKSYNFLKTIYKIYNRNGLNNSKIKFFMNIRCKYNDERPEFFKINSLFQKPEDYSKNITINIINSKNPDYGKSIIRFKNLEKNSLQSQVYEIDALFEMIDSQDLINNFIYEASEENDFESLFLSFQILHHFENYIKTHLQSNMTQLFLNYSICNNNLIPINNKINMTILEILQDIEFNVNEHLDNLNFESHPIFKDNLKDIELTLLYEYNIQVSFISKGGNLLKLLINNNLNYDKIFYLDDYNEYNKDLSDWDFDLKFNYKNPMKKMDFILESEGICNNKYNYIFQLLKKYVTRIIYLYFKNLDKINLKHNNILKKHSKKCIDYFNQKYIIKSELYNSNTKFILNAHGGCLSCNTFLIPENLEIIQFQKMGQFCINDAAFRNEKLIISNLDKDGISYNFPSKYPDYTIHRDDSGTFNADLKFILDRDDGIKVEKVFNIQDITRDIQVGQELKLTDIIVIMKEYLISQNDIPFNTLLNKKIRLYLLICTPNPNNLNEITIPDSNLNYNPLKIKKLHNKIEFETILQEDGTYIDVENFLDANTCIQETITFRDILSKSKVEVETHNNGISAFSSKFIGSSVNKEMFDLTRGFIGINLDNLINSSKIEILDFGLDIFNSNNYNISQNRKDYELYNFNFGKKNYILKGKTPDYLIHELLKIVVNNNSKLKKRLKRLFKILDNLFCRFPIYIPDVLYTSNKYYENYFLKLYKKRIQNPIFPGLVNKKIYFNINIIDSLIFLFIIRNFEIIKSIDHISNSKFFKFISSLFNSIYDKFIYPILRRLLPNNQSRSIQNITPNNQSRSIQNIIPNNIIEQYKDTKIYKNLLKRYNKKYNYSIINSFLLDSDLNLLITLYVADLHYKYGIYKINNIKKIMVSNSIAPPISSTNLSIIGGKYSSRDMNELNGGTYTTNYDFNF